MPDPDRDELTNRFRVWFNVEVLVSPCPPEKVLDIVCPCQVGSGLWMKVIGIGVLLKILILVLKLAVLCTNINRYYCRNKLLLMSE